MVIRDTHCVNSHTALYRLTDRLYSLFTEMYDPRPTEVAIPAMSIIGLPMSAAVPLMTAAVAP